MTTPLVAGAERTSSSIRTFREFQSLRHATKGTSDIKPRDPRLETLGESQRTSTALSDKHYTTELFNNSETGQPILIDYGTGGGGRFHRKSAQQDEDEAPLEEDRWETAFQTTRRQTLSELTATELSPTKRQAQRGFQQYLNPKSVETAQIHQLAEELEDKKEKKAQIVDDIYHTSKSEASPKSSPQNMRSLSPDKLRAKPIHYTMNYQQKLSISSTKVLQRVLEEKRSGSNVPEIGPTNLFVAEQTIPEQQFLEGIKDHPDTSSEEDVESPEPEEEEPLLIPPEDSSVLDKIAHLCSLLSHKREEIRYGALRSLCKYPPRILIRLRITDPDTDETGTKDQKPETSNPEINRSESGGGVVTAIHDLLEFYETESSRILTLALYILSLLKSHSLPVLPLLIDILHSPEASSLRGMIVDTIINIGGYGIETLLSSAVKGRDSDLESSILTHMANNNQIFHSILLPSILRDFKGASKEKKDTMLKILEACEHHVYPLTVNSTEWSQNSIDYGHDHSTGSKPTYIVAPPDCQKTTTSFWSPCLPVLVESLCYGVGNPLRIAYHIRSCGREGEKILISLLTSVTIPTHARVAAARALSWIFPTDEQIEQIVKISADERKEKKRQEREDEQPSQSEQDHPSPRLTTPSTSSHNKLIHTFVPTLPFAKKIRKARFYVNCVDIERFSRPAEWELIRSKTERNGLFEDSILVDPREFMSLLKTGLAENVFLWNPQPEKRADEDEWIGRKKTMTLKSSSEPTDVFHKEEHPKSLEQTNPDTNHQPDTSPLNDTLPSFHTSSPIHFPSRQSEVQRTHTTPTSHNQSLPFNPTRYCPPDSFILLPPPTRISVIDALTSQLLDQSNPTNVRICCSESLCNLSVHSAAFVVDELITIVNNENESSAVKESVVRALGSFGNVDERLEELLLDSKTERRIKLGIERRRKLIQVNKQRRTVNDSKSQLEGNYSNFLRTSKPKAKKMVDTVEASRAVSRANSRPTSRVMSRRGSKTSLNEEEKEATIRPRQPVAQPSCFSRIVSCLLGCLNSEFWQIRTTAVESLGRLTRTSNTASTAFPSFSFLFALDEERVKDESKMKESVGEEGVERLENPFCVYSSLFPAPLPTPSRLSLSHDSTSPFPTTLPHRPTLLPIVSVLTDALLKGISNRHHIASTLASMSLQGLEGLLDITRQSTNISMQVQQARQAVLFSLSRVDFAAAGEIDTSFPYLLSSSSLVDSIVETLFQACCDSTPNVRKAGVSGLGKVFSIAKEAAASKSTSTFSHPLLEDKAFLPTIYPYLGDSDRAVSLSAGRVLAQCGEEGELLLVEGLLRDSSSIIRVGACFGLGEAVKRRKKKMEEKRRMEGSDADNVEFTGFVGIGPLLLALRDQSWSVRTAASRVVIDIGLEGICRFLDTRGEGQRITLIMTIQDILGEAEEQRSRREQTRREQKGGGKAVRRPQKKAEEVDRGYAAELVMFLERVLEQYSFVDNEEEEEEAEMH
ncbi:hypothetical protein BLNAU_17671 [Blattamonas nauphoetae]|uniref:Uncharacterized protein n=1 Tax=Blattamonas nauphoetae TaxID=2049346 RepID=A0ABQ9XB32_9EUKA|nr:hypothetical protein BLNAU_17671 [Blattamonas nauphoetae]